MAIKNSFWILLFYAVTSFADVGRIYDLNKSKEMQRLVQSLTPYKYILLGEKHDNPSHHVLRGVLMATFDDKNISVVAEHIPYPNKVNFDDGILAGPVKAGFNQKGWRWPMHEPLFAAIAKSGYSLFGGNLDENISRAIAKEGIGIIPQELADKIKAFPLKPEAKKAIQKDLIDGHCGHIKEERVETLALAQRAKDASMARAIKMYDARRIFLVAGNGHVRKDYGVFTFLETDKTVSVGFLGREEFKKNRAANVALYDFIVLTDDVAEVDYCANFKK